MRSPGCENGPGFALALLNPARRQRLYGYGLIISLFTLLAACSPISALNATIPRSGYHVERDIAYGSGPRQKLDFYIPNHLTAKAPVILFFYGGSWQSGRKEDYLAFGQAFASEGIVVAIADYRLYPQVRYPSFIEDGARAFAFVHNQASQYGGDPGRVFLAGHSAGAYIAMMLAADKRYLSAAGVDPSWVHGVVGIAGPYNFLPLQDSDLIAIFGGANREDTQPLTYIDGKRPPMFLATGDDDTTVLPRNTYQLASKLKSFGSPVEVKIYHHLGHIGIILSAASGFRWLDSLRTDVANFVLAH